MSLKDKAVKTSKTVGDKVMNTKTVQKLADAREKSLGEGNEAVDGVMDELNGNYSEMRGRTDMSRSVMASVEKTLFLDIFREWKNTVKTIFGKQKDNEVLRDLGVKKGFWPGFAYTLWFMFILPAKAIDFLLRPKWGYINFLQRYLISPIFEADFISGNETPSKMLGELYEKYLHYLIDTKKVGAEISTIKPDSSMLDRVMLFAKLRIVATLLVVGFIATMLADEVDSVLLLINLIISYVAGFFLMISGGAIGGGFLIGFIIHMFFAFLTAYLLMIGVSFVVTSFREVYYGDRHMLMRFVDDSINYSITKSKELYGDKMAMEAYEMLLMNVVLDDTTYVYSDKPHFEDIAKKIDAETMEKIDKALRDEKK